MKRRFMDAGAGIVFAAVTLFWLSRLVGEPGNAIPGYGPGDNLAFLWNTWWMDRALTTGLWPFRTSLLFAPWGSDLALNTHTALPSAAAAALSHLTSIVAATNAVVMLHLFLNFTAAYALALRETRDRGASMVAAFAFGGSAYVGAHLAGHFNLIAAWVLPLAALLARETLERPRAVTGVLFGVVLGALPYVDYYYAVYAGLLVILIVLCGSARIIRPRRPLASGQRIALAGIAAVLAIDLAVILTIRATGGTTITIGGAALSLRGIDNPIALAGLLAFAGLAVAWVPSMRFAIDWRILRSQARALLMPFGIAVVIAAPVLFAVLSLVRHGDYVSQRYLWRSAPAGVDVGTLLLGNPSGLLWAGLPRRAFAFFGIDAVEQGAWIGPGVLVLGVLAVMWRRGIGSVRQWAVVAAAFGLWALGPDLAAFGHRIHLILPATLVRFIPVVANARIPGRAMIVVYLALAILAAHGFVALRERGHRTLAAVLLLLVALDAMPAPSAVFRLDRPAIYDALVREPGDGAVCELPLGLRDGFGETGRFDSRVLRYQMIHGRPIAGGFVARIPPRVLDAYQRDSILGPLLRLSGGASLSTASVPGARDAANALLAHGFRFVIVNRPSAPPDLLAYVATLPLRKVAEDDERTLYELLADDRGSGGGALGSFQPAQHVPQHGGM